MNAGGLNLRPLRYENGQDDYSKQQVPALSVTYEKPLRLDPAPFG
jgi:hypothetical protein